MNYIFENRITTNQIKAVNTSNHETKWEDACCAITRGHTRSSEI